MKEIIEQDDCLFDYDSLYSLMMGPDDCERL